MEIKEHPILMSTPMVIATYKDLKHMTRRVVSKNNSRCTTLLAGDGQNWDSLDFNDVVVDGKSGDEWYLKVAVPSNDTRHRVFCKWSVGDILWVRETWQHTKILNINPEDDNYGYVYKASQNGLDFENNIDFWIWKPSIFMPKKACRFYLEITKIRAERVRSITKEDAIDEGVLSRKGTHWGNVVEYFHYIKDKWGPSPVHSFETLWKKINGKDSWEENPWVWVVEYKVVDYTNIAYQITRNKNIL